MSPWATAKVLPTLKKLNRNAGGPVPAWVVAVHIGRCERQARNYLSMLEAASLVVRPSGPRSGWLALK
jgi:predicted transcriptional regulator